MARRAFDAIDDYLNDKKDEPKKDEHNNKKKNKNNDDYLFKKGKAEREQEGDLNASKDSNDSNPKEKLKNYKVVVPKRGEVHAVKILNDPVQLQNYLSGHHEPFFQGDNFQRRYLQELPKLLWQTEKVEELGDFVLLFPNPDKLSARDLDPKEPNGIQLKEAQDIFNVLFETNYTFAYKKQFMTALQAAFEATFLQLIEYKPPKDKSLLKKLDVFNAQESSFKQPEEAQVQVQTETQPFPTTANLPPGDKKAQEDAEIQAREIAKSKQRRVWNGGQSEQVDDPEKNTTSWKTEMPLSRDFLTLLRKTVCAVLANHGFLVREVFVSRGDYIALVLTLPEENMHGIAKDLGLKKMIEFGVADLMSLEPIDSKNRPLRISSYLRDEQKWEKSYNVLDKKSTRIMDDVTKALHATDVKNLRLTIISLLDNECNLKNIVRMCNSQWTEQTEDHVNDVYDHTEVPIEIWKDYEAYLIGLAIHMKQIEQIRDKIRYVNDKFSQSMASSLKGNKVRSRVDKVEVTRLINRLTTNAFKTCIANTKLKNLWMQLGTDPITYAYEYEPPSNYMRPRIRMLHDLVWADYMYHYPYADQLEKDYKYKKAPESAAGAEKKDGEDDQQNLRQTEAEPKTPVTVYHYRFTKQERIKLCNHLINKIININELTDVFEKFNKVLDGPLGIIAQTVLMNEEPPVLFPLHNRRVVDNTDYHAMFKDVRDMKKVYDKTEIERVRIQLTYDNAEDARRTSENQDRTYSEHKSRGRRDKSSRFDNVEDIKRKLYFAVKLIGSKLNTFRTPRLSDIFDSYIGKQSPSFNVLEGLQANHLEHDKSLKHHFHHHDKDKSLKDLVNQPDAPVTKPGDGTTRNKDIKVAFDNKKDGNNTEYVPQTVQNNEISRYRQIEEKYEIDGEKLVDSMYDSLTHKTILQDALLLCFKNLTVFDMKGSAELELVEPLNRHFRLTFWDNIKKYPEAAVINYFGEKVAMYFAFVNFYRDRLVYISIFGILVMIFQYGYYLYFAVKNGKVSKAVERTYEWTIVAFCCIITFWATYFTAGWETYQKEFSIKYGVSDLSEEKEVRNSFKGVLQRNPITDKINSIGVSRRGTKRKATAVFLIVMALLLGSFISSIYLLNAKRKSFEKNTGVRINESDIKTNDSTFTLWNNIEVLFNILEFIRIFLFQWIFWIVIQGLVRWQNLKYKQDHENRLILYLSLFQLINNSAVIIVIAIESLISFERVNANGDLVPYPTCLRDKCTQELSNFFLVYCIFQVFFVIFYKTIFKQWINRLYVKIKDHFKQIADNRRRPKTAKRDDDNLDLPEEDQVPSDDPANLAVPSSLPEDRPAISQRMISVNETSTLGPINIGTYGTNNKNESLSEQAQEKQSKRDYEKRRKAQNETLAYILDVFYKNPASIYGKIDTEIDYQVSKLDNEESSYDYDPNLDDYLSIYNNYSYTTMFGVLLPVSFFTSMIISSVETYLDKNVLLKYSKRPIPESANSIGLWFSMIKFVSIFSIFSNSFYVAFILFEDKSYSVKFFGFLIMTVLLVIFNTLYRSFITGLPERVIRGMERSEFIKDYLFAKVNVFSNTRTKQVVQGSNKIFNKVDTSKHINIFDAIKDASNEVEEKEHLEREVQIAYTIAERTENLGGGNVGGHIHMNMLGEPSMSRGVSRNPNTLQPRSEQNMIKLRDSATPQVLPPNVESQERAAVERSEQRNLVQSMVVDEPLHNPNLKSSMKNSSQNLLKVAIIDDPDAKYDAPGNGPLPNPAD